MNRRYGFVLSSATISLLLGASVAPVAALDKPAAVCQASLGKALLGFKKAKLKAWTKCLDATLTGKTCDATARDAAIGAAATKARDKVTAKCPGTLLLDAAPAGVGFDATCALKNGGLSAAEQACAGLPAGAPLEIADCLLCWKEAEIDGLLQGLYPCLSASIPEGTVLPCGTAPAMCPDPDLAKEEVACLRAVAKAGAKWFLADEKALEKCLNARRAGKTTDLCPDVRTSDKISSASAKAVAAIANGCDALPSFWDVCPFDSSAPCDEAISDVDSISTCAVDGADEIVRRLVCQQYPDADADGIACPSTCVPSGDDVCNGVDDDCDSLSADGSEDPALGMACDGADTDFCIEGTVTCNAGMLECDDMTSSTVELCDGTGADEDCDGEADNGFVLDSNPLCASGQVDLGQISGDTGAEQVGASSYDEQWYRVTLQEDDSGTVYLSATVQLFSPPGADFDLFVYCVSCGGTLAGSSTVGGLVGHNDTVDVRKDDNFVSPDDFDIIIEVRHFNSNVCANWSLAVFGNQTVAAPTCS